MLSSLLLGTAADSGRNMSSMSTLSIKGAARRAQIAAEASLPPATLTMSTVSRPQYQLSDDELLADAVQHTDLWFADGSVVLTAERTMFRVHISVLSRHSLFFRDMFSLPQAPGPAPHPEDTSTSNHTERCPVVHLHDCAEDLANLLYALYDGPYVLILSHFLVWYGAVPSIMSMCHFD